MCIYIIYITYIHIVPSVVSDRYIQFFSHMTPIKCIYCIYWGETTEKKDASTQRVRRNKVGRKLQQVHLAALDVRGCHGSKKLETTKQFKRSLHQCALNSYEL